MANVARILVQDDESKIRALIDDVTSAIQNRDLDTIVSAYSAGAVVYDVRDSLQYGIEGLKKSWNECFEMSKSFSLERKDLKIKVSGDTAFSFSLGHATGETMDGEAIDMWIRFTDCFSKVKGKWLAVHGHASVPGDFMNGTLLTDLKP